MHIHLHKRSSSTSALRLALLVSLAGCGSDSNNDTSDPPPPDLPPPTQLRVEVTDAASSNAVVDAQVNILDASTASTIALLRTDAEGVVTLEIDESAHPTVLVRIAAQGFAPSPANSLTAPVPHDLTAEETTTVAIALDALADAATLGAIAGRVVGADSATGVSAALVTASVGQVTLSVASADDGTYALFNVPIGTATVTAWHAGLNFDAQSGVGVVAGQSTGDVDVTAAGVAMGSVSGQLSFLASDATVVDITLLLPETGDVVPGLRTFNDAATNLFELIGVPDGTFQATASQESDAYVLDPDSIVKFGPPQVTIAAGSAETLDFDVTGAVVFRVPVDAPVLPSNEVTFEWEPYPSASDYVVEVSDIAGNVIWGGFTGSSAKAFVVESAEQQSDPVTSENYFAAQFDSDGSASEALVEGDVYRVRVYASKDVNQNQDPLGYKLISSTEGLEGVFWVGVPD